MEQIKKYMVLILAVVAIIAMFLPICSVSAEAEVMGYEAGSAKQSVSGFAALGKSVFSYFLLLGPAVLIAMNFIQQLKNLKGILTIVIPVVCIICLIILLLTAKSFGVQADMGDFGSVETKVSIGFGAILAFISYLATAAVGVIPFVNEKLGNK